MMRIRDIPVVFQDERLSTQAVERPMVEADMTRAKRAQRRDALAAVWILQSALDRLHDDWITSTSPARNVAADICNTKWNRLDQLWGFGL